MSVGLQLSATMSVSSEIPLVTNILNVLKCQNIDVFRMYLQFTRFLLHSHSYPLFTYQSINSESNILLQIAVISLFTFYGRVNRSLQCRNGPFALKR